VAVFRLSPAGVEQTPMPSAVSRPAWTPPKATRSAPVSAPRAAPSARTAPKPAAAASAPAASQAPREEWETF
jgi:hypothetical protein